MKKTKNDQSSNKPRTMFDLEVGSMEDLKTHEDFNNEHPNELDNAVRQKTIQTETKKIQQKN